MQRTLRRRNLGVALTETVVAAGLATVVLGASLVLTKTSTDVARSSTAVDGASQRVARVLSAATDEIRMSSLATVLTTDGAEFADGTSATGFRCRRVTGYAATPVLAAQRTVSYDSATRRVLRTDGTITEVLARNVTSFRVSRTGETFTVAVEAGSGSGTAATTTNGTMHVNTRNP